MRFLSWIKHNLPIASLKALDLNCEPLSLSKTSWFVFLMFFITALFTAPIASLVLAVRPIWLSMTVLSKSSTTGISKKNCFVRWIYPQLKSFCQYQFRYTHHLQSTPVSGGIINRIIILFQTLSWYFTALLVRRSQFMIILFFI